MKTSLVATLLSVALALPAFAEDPPVRTITARGTGSVSVHPDAADIRMVVFTEAALASSALQDNDVMTEGLLKGSRSWASRGRTSTATVPPCGRNSARPLKA
jgi:uncharacterized protein YggE